MDAYNPKKIEKKWQAFWEENQVFHATLDPSQKKYYALIEFPYPSGQGLHVGHPRPYTAMDVVARKRRLEGYNVLFPMGFDAFGLPTENYAIKNHVHPATVTQRNINHYIDQLKEIGFAFDWARMVETTDPAYYHWTQWIFVQLFKHGLAYKKETPINWCPSCKVGLANEEVVGGNCERCGTPVERRVKNQWMLKITAYADRLIDDLKTVDYLPKIKQQQIHWIGRSHGCEIDFSVADREEKIRVYTTRPDTIFGVTYMVLAPEHDLIDALLPVVENREEVEAYRHQASMKSDFERGELNLEKTGVPLQGVYAEHPVTGEKLPLWIADYVLTGYGTGAIMAVPAHDERDWAFAKAHNLPMRAVIAGGEKPVEEEPYTQIESGRLMHSGFLDGLSVKEAIPAAIDWVKAHGLGEAKVNYKLRDWVFSRQRYWGEPIPMIYCEEHGWVPVPEDELPLRLPPVPNYEPTATGESPLSEIPEFVETTCPICGKKARRETDTMPQWAGSSWYYLRYMDPNNSKAVVSKEAESYFGPVDWYNGGMEHTTLHLLYSRFWHKFLYDIGVVSTLEPYRKRTSHGMILGPNGEKMSKSRGNVIPTDVVVGEFGADAFRTYELFIGDFEKTAKWQDSGLEGCARYLDRVWRMQELLNDDAGLSLDLEQAFHQTIKKVSEDYENLKYNTAIAQLMSLSNQIRQKGAITREEMRIYLLLLNPVAPHMTEELWEQLGYAGHICTDGRWPQWDDEKLVEDVVELPVQVNGKVRATIRLAADASQEAAEAAARAEEAVQKQLDGKTLVKVIYVPRRILNLVVKG
uniref:leucine--tRNA ligase n=1 Tax=Ndongobacter massiliensis TaxID=1871025 RepID=UPI00093118FE|nr:leucine--tRNA ligase [Ndongobacter massiliensis]